MRNHPEPPDTWLPSTGEIFRAAERAILAALDANLQLAVRALKAEYPSLARDRRIPENWEPYVPLQGPYAEQIVDAAGILHGLITEYRTALEVELHDGGRDLAREDVQCGAELDEDMPF
jgi:hypothetical protein